MGCSPGGSGFHTTGFTFAVTVPVAPWSIHALSTASSSGFSASAPTLLSFGGMNGFVSFALHLRSGLSCDFRGTTTAPFSPPFKIVAGVSITRSPFASVALWHARQFRLKIGRTSVWKSTLFCNAGIATGTVGTVLLVGAGSAADKRGGTMWMKATESIARIPVQCF